MWLAARGAVTDACRRVPPAAPCAAPCGRSAPEQVRRFKVLDRDTKAESHDVVPWTQEVQLAALFATWPGRLLARSSCLRAYFRRRSEAKGRRYDSAQGAKQHIQQFIKDFSVNVDESERPFSEYATLNEFFARRLKDGLRPIDAPEDDQLLCCPCDGRYSCYQSLGAVRLLWIKGRHFSIAELVGATSRVRARGKEGRKRCASNARFFFFPLRESPSSDLTRAPKRFGGA